MEDFVEVRRYVVAILRWWWLIVLLAVVGGVIGFKLSQRQPAVYQATATLMVGQPIQATNLTKTDIQTSELLAQTYATIAQRQPILQNVVEELGLPDTWQALKEQVWVEPLPGTQLLEVTVEANSPEMAQVIANQIAHGLVELGPNTLPEEELDNDQLFVRQRLENLQTKVEAGQQRIEALTNTLALARSTERRLELQHEITTWEGLITDWENNYAQLLAFKKGTSKVSPNDLTIIEPAQASTSPVRPQPQLNAFLGAVLGFLLALGLVLLLEYLDDTLKSAADLSQTLGLTTLGAVGRMNGKRYQDKLIATHETFSPVSETYRMIRSNIQFMAVDRPVKSIMVTSPSTSEGKSVTVANLGMVMAQADLKTIIVDTDLRRPRQHEIFQIPNVGGMTDLLREPEPDFKSYVRKTNIENLHLIPSGVLPPNPSELLSSDRMKQVLTKLTELADVVIFDSPPVLAVADAAVLSNRVDGVLMVIHARHTRRNLARQALSILQQADANLLGGVLNQVPEKGAPYRAYYPSLAVLNKRPLAGKWYRWRWLPFLK
ncbi:MAG TPA: polysaccharide biosynthesis tyrosine autokinase [Anaerolineae bacterium]|nr:polysaccharide biosynthesis tyrosine autokinase [Anaerolineae bacterium]HMR62867.1 polysaccharide biosynthesis tyrosine autokinase [Anaerolineae bacterium]